MRTWLKRMVAGIASAGTLMGGGLLMAGTANADEIRMPDIGKTITSLTASAATTYPRELVNGGFDYLPAGGWNAISPKLNTSGGKFTSVDPVNGQYIRNAYVTDGNAAWVKWDGFDASKFGWISDQKGGKPQGFVTDHANCVELQRDNDTDNTYAEIVGSEIGKSIYQKIDTRNSTDAVYTVRFDHAALSSEHADGMQALVNGKPVIMTRIGGNKAGDKTGWTGTDIVTHATNTDHYRHDGQWATYEGKVTIPANTPVSTFTFRSLNEAKPDMGNLIDNLTFKIAYRLSYDSNGGTKAKASQISSRTEGKASETDGKVKTVADDAAGRAVLECKRSGEGATGPYADKFCWIDWSNLPLNRTGEPIPVRINVPSGHIDADATVAHTDNAALTAKDFTGNKWSRLIPAYRLTGNTALAFSHIQGNSADPLASVMFSNITPVVNQTATSVNVLKDFQLAFGDAETMSGYVVNDKKIYEQTDIESDKTLDKLGMIGDNNPNQSYSEANTGYGTTHVTLAGGPAGAHALTDEADSKGAAVIGATQPTRFKVSFKQVNHPADDSWSAIAIGVYMPYLTAYPLTYDKNAQDATGSVPSNQYGKENTVQPAKSKTTGSVGLAADKTASGLTVHDLKKNDKGKVPSSSKADSTQPAAFKAPDAKVETIASRAAGDELAVNGGFDTPKWTIAKEGQGLPWVYVTPNAGMIRSYAQAMAGQTGVKAGGLTAATFAWQDLDAIGSIQNFELHREKDGNTAADVHAGRTVAQTVNTTPGASYTFSIRHSGRSKGNAGGVTLLTGPDKDHLTPVRLTRTTVSKTGAKYGDKIGDVGTVAYTHSDSTDATEGSHDPWDHSDDWESYEGTVVIPAGQTRTMIAYKGAGWDGTDAKTDSIIDDLSFRLSYRLGYDANGGEKKNTSKTKASTDGAVKQIAAVTSKVPVHDLETTDVPANYRNFTFDTTKTRLSDARFDADWTTTRDEAGGSIHWPTRLGAKATLPNVGAWTDQNGTEHRISATIALKQWNGGNIGQLNRFDANGKIVGDGLFWINVVYDNKQPPASVRKTLGNIDTSKRVGCQWTVSFTYADGTPVPDTFRGVTGFNDLDGFDAQPDLRFEGVQLLSGFDGAYKTRDAELAPYGTNGYAGIKHDAGDESNLNGAQQVRHRLAATWTGPTFTYSYDLRNPAGRADGVRMTFGMPVTRTQILTYKANGGTGQVPSRTETGRTETAASGTDGTVRLAADKSAEPESGTIADDRRVLTDTTARQDDGTSQRTITRSDGSVRVETIATTGAVSGCQVYYPAGTRITLATAKADSDCWDSSQIGKTSRTFYGWSANTDANDRDVPVGDTMDRNTLNANVRTEIVMPARAKTVYALWAINPTLSYNVNTPAGSNAPVTPASRTVPYNTAAPDTSGWQTGDTGKIPGYRFDGWYTAPNGGNKYDFNTPLTNNVTVYAHWVGNGYTVRFAGNGATGGDTPDQAFQYNIGQNLRRNGFVRDGYTFAGWKRADNQQAYGDGQWVTNLTTQPNGIITMVAQWSANEAHIRYNPNPPAGKTTGGQGTPNWDGHTGDTPTIGQNGWTIDGYTFAGWATSPDGSGARYAPGARWTANGTLTLYAQWTPGQASLTYDGNGATGGKTDPQNGVTDQKVNVRQNGFTRDGYVFAGWNTQPDGRGQAWAPNAVWTLHGTGVLYALWRGNQQRLNYHGNGNTGGNTESQDGRTGDVLDTRANGFTRDGYEFVEWNTRADGTGDHYGKGSNGVAKWTMLPAGNDLYAIWQANPANIQYRDDWGATGSTPDTTGVTGQDVTIARNGFTRPGYTFTGWARDRRTNPSLQPGGRYTLTPGTTTLWAQWKADPAHLIYNANTGSTSQTHRTDGVVDQTLTVIANPFTRPGYTFTGWNTQADGKGRAYTAGNGFRLVADPKSNPVNTSVLYAQWRINRVTLKFNPNGGTGGYPDITVDAFTTVTIPADAKEPKVQRPGFRFTGWAMKPTPGAGDTILSPGKGTVSMPDRGSITVYAQWAPAMTTLPFTGGHAQVPTIGLYAGLAFMILAMGALMPVIRLRMAAARRGRHAGGTGTAGRHAR